jgi:hypothetical protein
MPTIKDTVCVLAVIAAYALTAYWDERDEQQAAHAGATPPPVARTTPDAMPLNTLPGIQHAQR